MTNFSIELARREECTRRQIDKSKGSLKKLIIVCTINKILRIRKFFSISKSMVVSQTFFFIFTEPLESLKKIVEPKANLESIVYSLFNVTYKKLK